MDPQNMQGFPQQPGMPQQPEMPQQPMGAPAPMGMQSQDMSQRPMMAQQPMGAQPPMGAPAPFPGQPMGQPMQGMPPAGGKSSKKIVLIVSIIAGALVVGGGVTLVLLLVLSGGGSGRYQGKWACSTSSYLTSADSANVGVTFSGDDFKMYNKTDSSKLTVEGKTKTSDSSKMDELKKSMPDFFDGDFWLLDFKASKRISYGDDETSSKPTSMFAVAMQKDDNEKMVFMDMSSTYSYDIYYCFKEK